MASYRDLAGALEAVCRAVMANNITPTSQLIVRSLALVAEAKAGRTSTTAWTPFEKATGKQPNFANAIKAAARIGIPETAAREAVTSLAEEAKRSEIYVNSRYQVMRRASDNGAVIYLSIKRLDQQPIRSWRDLQRIKNELVGEQNEGIELFPPEDTKIDVSNQYHLWVWADPTYRCGLGFHYPRHVADDLSMGEGQLPLGES